MMRVGLLASTSLSEFRVNTLQPILNDDLFSIVVAIIDNRPPKSFVQKLKSNLKLGRGGYVLVMAFQSIFSKQENCIKTEQFCSDHGIEVIETSMPYSDETINKIRKSNLDILLLLGGFGIIKEKLLTVTPFGVLSYHHGNMREYRGMPPAMWELYNNEKEMGVTVQVLAPGIDCGIPVEEKSIEILPNDGLKSLRERALKESEHMMYDALIKLSNPNFTPNQIEKLGKVYTLPNLRQWMTLNIKLLWRKIQYKILPKPGYS
jgi:folate-dependent phosphoribosylglycinamide formyltransferase PurN